MRVNSPKIIFFIEDLSHFRFVEKLFDYFYNNSFQIDLLCFELPFGNRKYDLNKINITIFQNDYEKINALLKLEGNLFITTTPSIGSPKFPKSSVIPKDLRPKYVYIFHSLVSPNEMYEKGSFKNFEIIFSPSNIISDQLMYLMKRADVFTTGYLLFDKIELFKFQNFFEDKVLLAPTWGSGYKTILDNLDIIKKFINKQNLELVFRPHPMSDINLLRKLDISIDNNKDLLDLHKYKYLITDFSGIALEYSFLTGRPIIFLDVEKKIKRKLKQNEKKLIFIEDEMRNVIGKTYSFKELEIINNFPTIEKDNQVQFIKEINYSENVLKNTLNVLLNNL